MAFYEQGSTLSSLCNWKISEHSWWYLSSCLAKLQHPFDIDFKTSTVFDINTYWSNYTCDSWKSIAFRVLLMSAPNEDAKTEMPEKKIKWPEKAIKIFVVASCLAWITRDFLTSFSMLHIVINLSFRKFTMTISYKEKLFFWELFTMFEPLKLEVKWEYGKVTWSPVYKCYATIKLAKKTKKLIQLYCV